MKRIIRVVLVTLATVVLSACASKNPMDYLPQGDVYAAINSQKFHEQEGCKRLASILEKLGETASITNRPDVAYVSVKTGGGGMPALYLVAIGKPGMSRQLFDEVLKTAKTTPVKIAGLSGVRVSPKEGPALNPRSEFILLELSDSAVIGASLESDIQNMVAVSKRKMPGAASTPEFQKCQVLGQSVPLAVVADVSRFVAAVPPQALGPLAQGNPKAAEAIKNLRQISLTAQWDQAPKVELIAYTDENAARDLAALINFFMGMQRQQLPAALKSLAAAPTKEGLAMKWELPKEEADNWLSKLEKAVAELPSDPAKRQQALQEVLPTLFR